MILTTKLLADLSLFHTLSRYILKNEFGWPDKLLLGIVLYKHTLKAGIQQRRKSYNNLSATSGNPGFR